MARTKGSAAPASAPTTRSAPAAPAVNGAAEVLAPEKEPQAGSAKNDKAQPAAPRKPEPNPEKARALNLAVGQIERAYGKGAIMRLDEQAAMNVPGISTGALSLDLALGGRRRAPRADRGDLRPRIQRQDHPVPCTSSPPRPSDEGGVGGLRGRAEHALDPAWARQPGRGRGRPAASASPTPASRPWRSPRLLVRSGAVDVVVVDSVAALIPRPRSRARWATATSGLQARLMSQALRKLTGSSPEASGTCSSSSTRSARRSASCSATPRPPPGGTALKFYARVRLDIRRIRRHQGGRRGRGQPRPA
ncbi:MAG: hypothetical protein KatS3mg103_0315 [Phycisphaerales bacterium]|nr:MAG: hypothetical protein KatS3mg103_0315 [Phycisphaerales bacterium]